MKLSQNSAILRDSIYNNDVTGNHTFYQTRMEYSWVNIASDLQPYLGMNIIMDEVYYLYKRSTMTFLDALSNAGGTIGLLFTIMNVLLSQVSK